MFPVRVWFSKTGPARFISHLDLMRYFTRALRRAKLPIWLTEGFNPHPYINFASPLSLGTEGLNECFDIKLTENLPVKIVADELSPVMTGGIKIKSVTMPLHKTAKIAFADYTLFFDADVKDSLTAFLNSDVIEIDKKGKLINVKSDIRSFSVSDSQFSILNSQLNITLPCSPSQNVNPVLIATAFCGTHNVPAPLITRNRLLIENEEKFE